MRVLSLPTVEAADSVLAALRALADQNRQLEDEFKDIASRYSDEE